MAPDASPDWRPVTDAKEAFRGTKSFDELFGDWRTRQAEEDSGSPKPPDPRAIQLPLGR
jgi:hypothetical protein